MPEFLHYFHGLRSLTDPKVVIQLVLIGYVLAWVWRRIKHTQAERLVKGLLVVALIFGASAWLGLTIITSILQSLIPVAVLALVITFQPEMRRGLGYLGRMERFRFDWTLRNVEVDKSQKDIDQIIAAVDELSRNRTGALIVVEPPEGERDYLSPGVTVNGDISSTLLLSIFFPNSPLHDGAVVIRQHKVVAAGVILPMTGNPKLSTKYGTRHRAALGLSEIYDGLCIVVSEETGSISAASRGLLVRYAKANELADPLSYIYKQPTDNKQWNPWNTFIAFIGRGSKPAAAPGQRVTANEQVVVAESIEQDHALDGVRDSASSLVSITEDARRSDLDKQSSLSA
jgi:diadenylate cyclase